MGDEAPAKRFGEIMRKRGAAATAVSPAIAAVVATSSADVRRPQLTSIRSDVVASLSHAR